MNTDKELMQQALNALEQVAEYFNVDSTETKTIAALRERLAQPDPVPYWHSEFLKHNTTSGQPAQQQEPVACPDGKPCKHGAWCTETYCQEHCEFRAPPQRKPLTDEEIMNLCASEWASHPIEVARVIEAAHGIGEKPDAA